MNRFQKPPQSHIQNFSGIKLKSHWLVSFKQGTATSRYCLKTKKCTDVHGFYSDYEFTFNIVFTTKKACLKNLDLCGFWNDRFKFIIDYIQYFTIFLFLYLPKIVKNWNFMERLTCMSVFWSRLSQVWNS